MKQMYFTRPKDAVFDVESIPLDTDAKDDEDVIATNDGPEIEAVKENEIKPSTQVQWADPLQRPQLSSLKQRRLFLKLLQ